jgi:hypothetical protein
MVFYLKKYIKTELYAKKEGTEHDNPNSCTVLDFKTISGSGQLRAKGQEKNLKFLFSTESWDNFLSYAQIV